MALFPRQRSILDIEIVRLAYETAKVEKTESAYSAFWGAYLIEKFPHSEGYLVRSEKYFAATPAQQQSRARHKWFKIDHAIDQPDSTRTQLITLAAVEIKRHGQSTSQDERGETNLTNVCKAALHKDRTTSIWTMQCKGFDFCLKNYTPAIGLDASKGTPENYLVFPGDEKDISEMMDRVKGRGSLGLSDPAQRYSGGVESRHQSIPVRPRPQHERGKSVETGRQKVQGVRDRRENKDGWLFEYRGRKIFASDDYWTKGSSSGKTIWLSDQLPIYIEDAARHT